MSTGPASAAGAPVVLVVSEPEWAEPLVRWAWYEAGRQERDHLVICVPDRAALAAVRASLTRLGTGSDRVEVVEHVAGSAPAIAAQVKARGGALPVVGPLPPNVLAQLVLGTVDHDVSTVVGPVVVVPPGSWSTRSAESSRSGITVGFHGSEPARAALRWAADIAQKRDAEVRAVMVWLEGNLASICGSVPINLRRHALAGPAVLRLAESVVMDSRLGGSRLHPVARRGAPCAVLAREAHGSDLLVVGAGQTVVHGHPVLGPVTLGCIGQSPVPVAIVPWSGR